MQSPLDDRVFRANSNYDLLLLDRLPIEEQQRLASLRRESDLYGVFKPRVADTAARTIAASREVALLFFTLQRQPGPLPSYLRGASDDVRTIISQLVLDGVLDVESNGTFVSGAAALEAIRPQRDGGAHGRIADLSRRAVEYAARFDAEDATPLEVRLYMYNRRPVTADWSARVSSPTALRRHLDIDGDGALASTLRAHWHMKSADLGEGWIHWLARGRGNEPLSRAGAVYKLYVSPTLEHLADAFPIIARVLADAEAPAFKIGSTLHGIARSDKLVAYFESRADALDCGEMLAQALHGVSPQGVPFSADIGGDGLVSWGVDPPKRTGAEDTQSWRGWVCRRLAHYLHAARQTPDDSIGPAHFALERLELDGVDTITWTPDVTRLERPAPAQSRQ